MKKYSKYCEKCKETDTYNVFEHEHKNIIIYGNNNIDNYCYALNSLKMLSKSELKYSRRIAINYNGEDVFFNISDIHFEVDFDLLGVNEYNIFLELFRHIKDNIVLNKDVFYIMCLNFQMIKPELLTIFYSFMNDKKIRFLFTTTKISFLCEKILFCSYIKKIKGTKIHEHVGQTQLINDLFNIVLQSNSVSLFQLRELLYKFLTFNYNIHDCITQLIFNLIQSNYIDDKNVYIILKTFHQFIMKYNNNYRPIYHIESFILFLINLKKTQDIT